MQPFKFDAQWLSIYVPLNNGIAFIVDAITWEHDEQKGSKKIVWNSTFHQALHLFHIEN